MPKPSVCAVMLVNGREAMVRRAIRSFEAQTYENKWLLLLNTGEPMGFYTGSSVCNLPSQAGQSVGELRNLANQLSCEHTNGAEVLIHWDSDDYSHLNRIAEQVALLESSGKECVGYRDMLFWNETPGQFCGAWMYSNHNPRYCLGTSLCYWRHVWEKRPFPDAPKRKGATGEDTLWIAEVDSVGDRSLPLRIDGGYQQFAEPRMIASIHGNNTQDYRYLEDSPSWRRAPEFDGYCRERMAL